MKITSIKKDNVQNKKGIQNKKGECPKKKDNVQKKMESEKNGECPKKRTMSKKKGIHFFWILGKIFLFLETSYKKWLVFKKKDIKISFNGRIVASC